MRHGLADCSRWGSLARCSVLGMLVASLHACSPAEDTRPTTSTLRVVPTSDLQILDPSFSSSYVARDHGFMIYDTLFGLDAEQKIAPQMVEHWEVSADSKAWTFTLRDGLEFHDGTPVTSEDVIASIRRWGTRDVLGQRLLDVVSEWTVMNAKTFRMNLTRPYGLVLDSLAKPDTHVPFIYPKRLADTPADRPIGETTGSGPFIFKRDEWKTGERLVYVRNPRYRPRQEPPSGTAGGKVVKVDRVEWVIIKDPQTQANALIAGDVDLIVEPPFTQYPSLRSSSDIQMFVANTVGYGFYLRFNHLQPPFDKPIARQAAMAAMNQSAFLRTQVGDAELYRTCFSVYHCKTRFAVPDGMDFIAKPDPERARRLLSESGYDGTRVVILQSTDMSTLARLPVVAAQLLERAGFKVTVEAMDSQTVQMRRAKSEGWNIFLYYGSLWSGATPISALSLSAAGEKAWFGWPSDVHLEQLRHAFAFATTDEERMALATQIQVRAMQVGTHVPLGEFTAMLAARKNVRGFVVAPVMALWNVEKDR